MRPKINISRLAAAALLSVALIHCGPNPTDVSTPASNRVRAAVQAAPFDSPAAAEAAEEAQDQNQPAAAAQQSRAQSGQDRGNDAFSVDLKPSVPEPRAEAEIAHARWAMYCDLAANPILFAQETEIAALALALRQTIRLLAKWPGPCGTKFTESDFLGTPKYEPQTPP